MKRICILVLAFGLSCAAYADHKINLDTKAEPIKNAEIDMRKSEMKSTKTLVIRWQRLVSKGHTCPRCGSTEEELEKATSTLKQSLAPLGIGIIIKKEAISAEEFKKNPLQSNRIWLNDQPFEKFIGGKVSKSQCSGACGSSKCRTVGVGEETYEVIPADIIIKAGLLAASKLVSTETEKSCGCN